MSVYLGFSRPCSPSIKDTFSAFDEKDGYLPLSPLDTSSTESSSPPTSHYDGFLVKDEPNDLFSNYLQIPNEIDSNNTKEKQIITTKDDNNLDKEGLFKIRVLGIPETGAKSRVETQIKLCLQVVDKENNHIKITDYSFIRLKNSMLARSRLKKIQQNGSVIVSDSKVLDLEAKVITSSGSTDQPIRMCVGCVRRERKRAERTKEKSPIDEIPTTIEEERDRILIFNCNPMINFNSGDTILPTRITCYCRHHDEKVGFRVCFVMRNDKGEIVASGMSSPIMITDDHKSSKKKTATTITDNESSNSNNSKKKRTRSHSIDNKNKINNKDKSQPDTPLHTPKSEKQDIPTTTLLQEVAAAAALTDRDDGGVSNMFQPNDSDHWPFNRRRRTDEQGHFYSTDNENDICSMPTTPLTEDEFSASEMTSFLPFTSSFTPPADVAAPSQPLPIPPPSLSMPTLSIPHPAQLHTSTSSSSSTSSLSSMPFIPPSLPLQLPMTPTTTTTTTTTTAAAAAAAVDAPTSTIDFMSILNRPLMPQINRLVPSQGPIYGGTEVSVLGSGFYQGLTCVFGEQVATTLFWSENTMVCLLPPTHQPGPVVVSLKEHPIVVDAEEVSIFTYYDASDQALLELALQLVGMKSTGNLQNAKQVAMSIIVQGKDLTTCSSSTGHTMLHLCVLLNYMDVVKEMMEKLETVAKMDVLNAQDRYGMTALHLACQLNAYDTVKILIEAGADTCVKDKLGYTPSSYIPVYKNKNKAKKNKDEEDEEKEADHDDTSDGDSKKDENEEDEDEDEKCIKDLFPISSLSPPISIPPPPKRKSLSRRSSMKGGHLMHRFHSLTKETKVEETTAPTMESDGLGFVQPKLDKRLYLFWLPVLIVAIGLLFVQLMGHPGLFEPLLEKMPHRLSFTI